MSGFEWLFGASSTSAGTMAAESAAMAQTGATAASVTAAGQSYVAANAGVAGALSSMTAADWAKLGSTVLSTASQVQGASAAAAQGNELAKQAISQARQDEFTNRRQSTAVIAKQRATMAAAGLEIDSGTPLELTLDSAYNAELNALNIRKQGEYNANYYRTQARRSKAQIPGMIFGGLLKGYGDYTKMKGP